MEQQQNMPSQHNLNTQQCLARQTSRAAATCMILQQEIEGAMTLPPLHSMSTLHSITQEHTQTYPTRSSQCTRIRCTHLGPCPNGICAPCFKPSGVTYHHIITPQQLMKS
jgi:hypothetical protein